MHRYLTALALVASAGAASAQQANTPMLMTAAPGGASEFCFYNSLAFSKNSILTIDITNRRESPSATQLAMLQCAEEEGSEGLVWVRIADE